MSSGPVTELFGVSFISVQNEIETGRGWGYDVVVVAHDDAPERRIRVTLSWADYEYWSHGSRAPAEIVRRLVEYLFAQNGFTPPDRFDAATARRWFPSIDEHLSEYG